MKKNRTLVAALTTLALALALVGVACASDDENVSAKATDKVDNDRDSGSGGQSSDKSGSDDSAKYEAEAEKRGEPKLSKVDAPADLEITDDVEGTGETVKDGATVTVQYAGAAAKTGEVFDSSWSRGEPIEFPLDGVIEGWTKGLVGMKEGGRRTLVIPPELAYGNGGPAPGDALVFVVDLINVDNV